MKDLLQKFRELINSEFHYADDKGNTITLFETEDSSKCQYVKLRKGNIKTFTLQLDRKNNQEIHPLLAPIEKLKVKCDYILFCLKKNTVYVLLIEMKSDNATGWTKQTRAGEIIARYLIGMVENFFGFSVLRFYLMSNFAIYFSALKSEINIVRQKRFFNMNKIISLAFCLPENLVIQIIQT